jgi:acyl-coenzyme A thioesterase PaaI-like protein
MTLMDIAMAHAARSPLEPGGEVLPGVVTIEMKTSFMRPGEGRLVGTGRRLHRTASLSFCEASVVNHRGELVGHSTGTFKTMRGLPAADGRRIQRLNASD